MEKRKSKINYYLRVIFIAVGIPISNNNIKLKSKTTTKIIAKLLICKSPIYTAEFSSILFTSFKKGYLIMIDKQYSRYELTCDVCGTQSETNFDDFQEAVNFKKSEHWKSKKIDDIWIDICPDCENKIYL